MKMNHIIMSIIATGAIVGCVSTTPADCDPSVELGVFQKMSCLNSGNYDARITDKQTTLAKAQSDNTLAHEKNQAVLAQKRASDAQVASQRAKLAKLNRRLSRNTAAVKQKAKGKRDILAKIDNIENQIEHVNNGSGTAAQKQAELKRLQYKLSTLEQALGI